MSEAVTAADANRKFSHILRGVRDGHSYVVTSHGRPVAHIGPAKEVVATPPKARQALLQRLRQQRVVEASGWTRDELYEDPT